MASDIFYCTFNNLKEALESKVDHTDLLTYKIDHKYIPFCYSQSNLLSHRISYIYITSEGICCIINICKKMFLWSFKLFSFALRNTKQVHFTAIALPLTWSLIFLIVLCRSSMYINQNPLAKYLNTAKMYFPCPLYILKIGENRLNKSINT